MNEADFDLLAAKVLMGEASPREVVRLDRLVASEVRCKARYAELEEALAVVRAAAPALPAPTASPKRPSDAHRAQLRRIVRRHFAQKPEKPAATQGRQAKHFEPAHWLGELLRLLRGQAVAVSVAVVVAVLALGYLLWPASTLPGTGERIAYLLSAQGRVEVVRVGKRVLLQSGMSVQRGDKVILARGASARFATPAGALQRQGPQQRLAEKLLGVGTSPRTPAATTPMQLALFAPVNELLSRSILMRPAFRPDITVYSPLGATRSLNLVILWKAEPGKTYELSIRDEFNSNAKVWERSACTPPVEFSAVPDWQDAPLLPGRLYRLRLSETANPGIKTERTFEVLKDATLIHLRTPTEKIEFAHGCLASDSPTYGDALAALMTLPAAFAEAELVLRLKLVASGELGLEDEYKIAADRLKQLNRTGKQ